jgi:hypothetical protein
MDATQAPIDEVRTTFERVVAMPTPEDLWSVAMVIGGRAEAVADPTTTQVPVARQPG